MYRPVGAVPVQNQTPVADRPALPGMHTGNRIEVLAQRRRTGIEGAHRPNAGGRAAGAGMVPTQDRQVVVATLADCNPILEIMVIRYDRKHGHL